MLQAEANLVHPIRVYVTGRSKCGKTTEVVRLIDKVFRPQIDRMVVCIPSWESQSTFDPIRDLVKPGRDVLNYADEDPFYGFLKELIKISKTGKKINTLLVVDDMAGQQSISKRMSSFANLSVQAPHLGCSIVSISQTPKAVCSSFRQNADAFICFPPTSSAGRDWLHEELNGNQMTKVGFDKIIDKAWRGKRKDYDELNQHFLFVLLKNREKTRYFVDFAIELESVVGNGRKRKREDK